MRRHIVLKPWLWPLRLLGRLTAPVAPGLWLINVFCQRVLDLNGATPWMVHFTSRVGCNIRAGRNVWISFAVSGGCYMQATNGIEIGDDTIFAPGVKLISANHDPIDYERWMAADPIRIGRGCWIGANAVLLPGVQLGDQVIVGAGAVVTKSFPGGVVIAGVPAEIVRDSRLPGKERESSVG